MGEMGRGMVAAQDLMRQQQQTNINQQQVGIQEQQNQFEQNRAMQQDAAGRFNDMLKQYTNLLTMKKQMAEMSSDPASVQALDDALAPLEDTLTQSARAAGYDPAILGAIKANAASGPGQSDIIRQRQALAGVAGVQGPAAAGYALTGELEKSGSGVGAGGMLTSSQAGKLAIDLQNAKQASQNFVMKADQLIDLTQQAGLRGFDGAGYVNSVMERAKSNALGLALDYGIDAGSMVDSFTTDKRFANLTDLQKALVLDASFEYAKSKGQTGAGLSDKDFRNALNSLGQAASSPESMINILNTMKQNTISTTNDKIRNTQRLIAGDTTELFSEIQAPQSSVPAPAVDDGLANMSEEEIRKLINSME